MRLSHTLGGCDNMVHGREFPMNSVIMKLDNGTELVCYNFYQSSEEPLELFCYIFKEKKWVKTYARNKYTEMMWEYYRKNIRKKKTHHKKWIKSKKKKIKGIKPVKVPNSVSWSMAHPFQGGRVSPR